jgi:hypothetical protein
MLLVVKSQQALHHAELNNDPVLVIGKLSCLYTYRTNLHRLAAMNDQSTFTCTFYG